MGVGEEGSLLGGRGDGCRGEGDGCRPHDGRFEHEGQLDEADGDVEDGGDDDEHEEADGGEADRRAYLPGNGVILVALVPAPYCYKFCVREGQGRWYQKMVKGHTTIAQPATM